MANIKLRNKKTGEIGEFRYLQSDYVAPLVLTTYENDKPMMYSYNSLAELNEEWEDYEEPEEFGYWYYDTTANRTDFIEKCNIAKEDKKLDKQIGNYFETKEEAEKAVEKLKAWKRLRDGGFRFDHIRAIDGVSIKHKDLDQYTIIAYADEDGCDQECLDLLFGGEE